MNFFFRIFFESSDFFVYIFFMVWVTVFLFSLCPHYGFYGGETPNNDDDDSKLFRNKEKIKKEQIKIKSGRIYYTQKIEIRKFY